MTGKRNPGRTPPGPGVDAAGAPVVDPTRNVRDLVAAENRRQDDLREMEAAHVREVSEIRADCQTDEIAGVQHIEQLRADHAKEIRLAETARIDAIRAVDVQAVQQAATVQAAQAGALAATVATSAEAMRAQVAAAASAAATSLGAALEPIQKDIQDLRKAQYEAQGVKAQSTEGSMSNRAWLALALTGGAIALSGTLEVAGIVITLLLR
jgi:hypothetical protein